MNLLSAQDLAACDEIVGDAGAIVAQVIAAVSKRSGITAAQIVGPGTTPRIVRARQIVMLACHNGGLSSGEIGRALGRDHSTVLRGIGREKARRVYVK